jgi:hypothetical protein
MNKYEYHYTDLNWVRCRLDKEKITYEINGKERIITITTELEKSAIDKIVEWGI